MSTNKQKIDPKPKHKPVIFSDLGMSLEDLTVFHDGSKKLFGKKKKK